MHYLKKHSLHAFEMSLNSYLIYVRKYLCHRQMTVLFYWRQYVVSITPVLCDMLDVTRGMFLCLVGLGLVMTSRPCRSNNSPRRYSVSGSDGVIGHIRLMGHVGVT